ncbi:acyltransferase family protein [Terasakiella pusilla]|uniref:acyltransferase family protein n=1 Tax=Terasakiella pusilla TaxID=64973 RepID=UPI003AA9BB6C
MSLIKYRRDIDGLRALAVLPVVFFHAGIDVFSGGFVGVDIFFVISGFLITSILIKDIQAGTFSLKNFYERRARRILPALFLVCFLSFAAGAWLLLPFDFNDFSQSLLATLGFASNIHFYGDIGYFAGPADFKPLLHTWSLAVEEQFYIFFPLILIALYKFCPRALKGAVVVLLVISLSLNLWGIEHNAKLTFYFLHTRAWELLFGAILALGLLPSLPSRSLRQVTSLIGLGLILYATFTFTHQTLFPGYAAIIPALGALLLIWSNDKQDTIIAAILSWRPFVFIGLISYSLYLWHWPVIVYTKIYLDRPLDQMAIAFVLALSLIGATLSWRFVEQIVRRKQIWPTRKSLSYGLGGVFACILILGLTTDLTDGLPNRLSPTALTYLSASKDLNPDLEECNRIDVKRIKEGRLCPMGPSDQAPRFLLWGDSHADAIMPGIKKMAEATQIAGLHASFSDCPPLLGVIRPEKTSSYQCAPFNQAMFDFLKKSGIKTLILAARWNGYAQGAMPDSVDNTTYMLVGLPQDRGRSVTKAESKTNFKYGIAQTLPALQELGVNIWIVEQAPAYKKHLPNALTRAEIAGKSFSAFTQALPSHQARSSFVADAFAPYLNDTTHYLRLSDTFCPQTEENCLLTHDGIPLYRDSHHLSAYGSRWVAEAFAPVFTSLRNVD